MTGNPTGMSGAHPSAFETELVGLVHERIASLGAAGALDASSGDVLDRMIDGLVAQRQAVVDSEAVQRREAVKRRIALASASLDATSASADADLGRARLVAVEIEAVCRRLDDDGAPALVGAGDGRVDVAALRSGLAAGRAEAHRDQRAALASVRVRSGSSLKVKRSAVQRRAVAAERQYEVRRRLHARAVADLEAAQAAFRGEAPRDPSVTTRGLPQSTEVGNGHP